MGGNEPVNNKTFGGVTFNWNEVKSSRVTTDQNGKKIYFIEFKTGVTAEYPEQTRGNVRSMNSRELTMWQSFDYDTETILQNMEGVTIKGSKKDDHIVAKGVENSTIDVSGDNNDDHVDVESEDRFIKFGKYEKSTHQNSSGNKVILGENDTATRKIKHVRETIDVNHKRKVDETEHNLDVKGPGIESRM